MEIDFLGLKSPKFNIKQQSSYYSEKDSFSGGGGVETSLSLSTKTTSLDYCNTDILNFSEKNTEVLQQPRPCLVPKPTFHHSTTTGILFDLNQSSNDSRNNCEIPGASLPMIFSGSHTNVFNDILPSQKAVRISGKASLGLSNGDTPTVAMARRATLARFLEKRSHRMNDESTSNLMAKSLNDGIKKRKNSLTRS